MTGTRQARLAVPHSIRAEHRELRHRLTRAVEAGGTTGEAARRVADLIHPHMLKEEEFALRPLGALAALLRGESIADGDELLVMSARLEREVPSLIREHDEIVRALQRLIATAKEMGQPEMVDFAEALVLHAEMEEEVLYPAAVLAGEILNSRR